MIGYFKNDSNFNHSIIDVFDSYKTGCENGYYKIGLYYFLPEEKQTDSLFEEIKSLAYLADSLITIAEDSFIKAQVNFANKYELEFEEIQNN